MKRFSLIITLLALVTLLTSQSSALASENAFKEVFQDAFYGGAAGTLVGLALTAFAKKPADHLDNLAYGAAAGILAGAAYGLTKSARALAEIDNGRVRIGMPSIVPDLVEPRGNGQPLITWRADILRGTFR
jgi:hypothetical protein